MHTRSETEKKKQTKRRPVTQEKEGGRYRILATTCLQARQGGKHTKNIQNTGKVVDYQKDLRQFADGSLRSRGEERGFLEPLQESGQIRDLVQGHSC